MQARYQGCTNYDPGLTLTHDYYAIVKFGYIGFCMGENENYLFFGNYCSLRSFVWEKMKIIYFLETIAALGLKVA